MGVTGTGKTTVGRLLGERLGVPFADADDFHPDTNIAKMSRGTPLEDADRWPWLDAIGRWAAARGAAAGAAGVVGGVVGCSALKRSYRDRLRAAAGNGLFFLHLVGDQTLLTRRLTGRRDHFMPPSLLASQLAVLEPLESDEAGMELDVSDDSRSLAARAAAAVRLL
ncbi:gluconokinase [Streptomyces alkaliterrae]|uniref:Gluconokinase n=1 Tax=Streptomyces alkaliterrae TaxID=2213162 RepID=A0A5P0YVQ0_9ACTN|nr:gluconokinase [Streptomyces alkaliterrae]MBB1252258.1 gluconokinase [Streptomyces alkaliterrae]MBB1257942.1 gluconokinase [Streptomyces alkaliterrae]MQS03552.1 gluconokinase [Streptomyces alkaliterrae]